MPSRAVLNAFLQTFLCGVRITRCSPGSVNAVKKRWADDLIRIFGVKLTVEGVAPKNRPQILVGNHISFLDIPVLVSVYPDSTFIAKDDLLRWPIIGPAAKAGGTIFVDRKPGATRTESRNQIVQLIREMGSTVVVFPSGTTSLDEVRVWKKGIFEIAQELKIPVTLFKLEYTPARTCAYIDDDQLLSRMHAVAKLKEKAVRLTWLHEEQEVLDPQECAERLRKLARALT